MFLRTFPTAVKKLPPPNVFPQCRPFRDIGLAGRVLHHFINGATVTPPLNISPGAKVLPKYTIEQVNKNTEKEYSQHGLTLPKAGCPDPFPHKPAVIAIWPCPIQNAPGLDPIDSGEQEQISWNASADGG